MEVKRICAAYWSATGNTDKTVNTIAETLAEKLGVPLERRNFTRPSDRAEDLSFTGGDLVVFGMPTYAGKLPNKMLPYVQQQIHGNGALAVGGGHLRQPVLRQLPGGAVRRAGGGRLPHRGRGAPLRAATPLRTRWRTAARTGMTSGRWGSSRPALRTR